jgi:hypothetical protein
MFAEKERDLKLFLLSFGILRIARDHCLRRTPPRRPQDQGGSGE